MSFSSRAFVGVLALVSGVHAMAFAGPEPTTTQDSLARVEGGWSPNPTQAPNFELVKREVAGADTCGWYSDLTTSKR